MENKVKIRFLEELRKISDNLTIREAEPMRLHTTFRVGGPADVLVAPDTGQLPSVLKLCKKYNMPYYVVGNGSNLLVGDGGIRGVVIQMTGRTGEIVVKGNEIAAGAGVLLSQIANRAAECGLSGMEFAAGIPGSVGGAVVMNAGAYGGEMKDIISHVQVLDQDGEEKELSVEELELSYRHSCIIEKNYIVVSVHLKLQPGNQDEIKNRMRELREKRMEKQPLEYPSAGSTFKRPEGYFAGKLIMDAGLRGFQIGGARVSDKHCGFVINAGNATAADIVELMQKVSEEVENRFGVVLEPEVKRIGDFSE